MLCSRNNYINMNANNNKIPRWLLQYRIQHMLIVVTVACCVSAWAGHHLLRFRDAKRALQVFEKYGGRGQVKAIKPKWFADLVGANPSYVITKYCSGSSECYDGIGSALLSHYMNNHTEELTDQALVEIRVMRELQSLWIESSRITDDGIMHLRRCNNVEDLKIRAPMMTDKSLQYLRDMKSLESITLIDTNVSDSGIRNFKKARPDVKVCIQSAWSKRANSHDVNEQDEIMTDEMQRELEKAYEELKSNKREMDKESDGVNRLGIGNE